MLSRRFRLIGTIVSASLLLLMVVNYDSMPWRGKMSLVTDTDTMVVHKGDYDYDNKGSQFESLVFDNAPLYTPPPKIFEPELPTSVADEAKPTKIAHHTPVIDGTPPASVVKELSPSEITDVAIPDQTVADAATGTAKGTAKANANTKGNAQPTAAASTEDVDWSRFAYTQYVTNKDYLCNSVMIFETLYRLGSQADRVMMYPAYMLPDPEVATIETASGKLLIQARDQYKAKLVPIEVQHRDTNLEDETWNDSYTKLLAFNQTNYDRVLALDSDSTVLQPMDELFLMPPCPVAMPRAYWLLRDDPPKRILSSQIMLLQPDATEFERIQEKTNKAGDSEYDMEIVNELYLDSATILPHRKYDMLTAEFRGDDHELYLGSDREEWDPVEAFKEAKFMHFSDWPVPKPWFVMDDTIREAKQPKCKTNKDGAQDCRERDMWTGIYQDFLDRRQSICGLPGKPAPQQSFAKRRTGRPVAMDERDNLQS